MKRVVLMLLFVSLSLVLAIGGQARALDQVVFSTDFESGLPSEMSAPGWRVEEMETGVAEGSSGVDVSGYSSLGFSGDNFLRTIGKSADFENNKEDCCPRDGAHLSDPNQAGYVDATLTLTGLPPHDGLDLNFLLADIDSTDREPFVVRVDGTTVFNANFRKYTTRGLGEDAGVTGVAQSDWDGLAAGGAGSPDANEVATIIQTNWNLGYADNVTNGGSDAPPDGGWSLDSAWDMGLASQFNNISHTASSLTIEFRSGLNGADVNPIADGRESFALDDITVTLIPEPASLGLLGLGLGALATLALRRRR